MAFIPERSKLKQNYNYLEHVLTMVENYSSIKSVIDDLLSEIAQQFSLDAVTIKEFTSDNSVRCTYEWCSDNNYELLNVEERLQMNIKDIWSESFDTNDGYWIYYANEHEGILCDSVIGTRFDLVKSCIEFPIYISNNFIGCIDLIDSKNEHRQWDNSLIEDIKGYTQIIGNYLLPLREFDNNFRTPKAFSEYDAVTHLPKYEIFYRDVESYLEKVPNGTLGMLSVDYSNFKYLNDKYGYREGNEILSTVAKYIYSCSNMIVSCCRTYSDHFLVAFKPTSGESFSRIRELAEDVSTRSVEVLRRKYYDVNIIMNVGVYFMKPGEKDIKTAIGNAGLARKFVKRTRAISYSRVLQYNISMSVTMRKQTDYIASMQKAILDNDFFVQLQPKCMTDNFTIIGAEALIRWKKDDLFVVLPDEFIQVFENNGCIVRMDYFVYDKVFKYIRERMDAGKDVVPISVNVSIVHFSSTYFIQKIIQLQEKYNINPEYLEFEFTEQVYVLDNPNVKYIIDNIREMGFRIFIGDFGTGYSSLNTMQKYKIDGIKLDRKFMKPKLDEKDKVIISCVVNMANKLNLEVICEGVESEQQRLFLLENSCPYMQGYYFSYPLDIDQFDELLDNQ